MELDIKRCYFPGIILKATCPECKTETSSDMTDQYLSYPKTDEPISFGFYCSNDDCQHEWDRKLLLTLKLEMLPEG